MSLPLRRRTILSMTAAIVIGACGLDRARAQERNDPGDSASPKPANPKAERASGVIIKAESIAEGATPGSTIDKEAKRGRAQRVSRRLTINTAVVWRDWARDQLTDEIDSPKKEAAEGEHSIGTKGQPVSKETLVIVDLGPETKIETRFRSVDDESGKGAKTPAEARKAGADPADTHARDRDRGRSQKASRPARFQVDDLLPGLFVEVDFRHTTAQNVASTVTVIRPVE